MFIPLYGSIGIQGYGVALSSGVLLALYLASRNSRYQQLLSMDQLTTLVNGAVLTGLVGGRLLNYITEYHNYAHVGSLFLLWEGGYDSWGAIIGATAFIASYAHYYCISVWALLDMAGNYAPLIQALARIGCFSYGCCGGVATKLPWALYNEQGILAHPTQLYSAGIYFIIFLSLTTISKTIRILPAVPQEPRPDNMLPSGALFALYLICTGLERFSVDFFRNDRLFCRLTQRLSIPQLIALSTICIGRCIWSITHYVRAQRYEHLQRN